MHKPSPCKPDCPNRSPVCHGTCEKYIEWFDRRKKIKSKINKEKALDWLISRGS